MNRVVLIRIAVVVLAAGALEAACRLGLIDRFTMIPPSEMATGIVRLFRAGKLNAALLRTFADVLTAFAAAVVVGVAAGAVIHRFRGLRLTLDPLFAAYYAVPIFAFYPMFVVMLGLDGRPQIFIGFLLATVAVIVSTLNGFDRTPRVFMKTAKTLQMSRINVLRKISLPAAMPHIFTGIKLAIAYAFTGVIGSEFILSQAGLGFEVSYAYNNFDNATMYPLILLVLVAAIVINMTFHSIERVLLRRRGPL
jgi:NitT/TauT family transport system permease protein